MADEGEDNRVYIVLVNAEEQYSLWPKEKKIPLGWDSVCQEGTKSECASYGRWDGQGGVIPIGRALSNTRLYVLDEELEGSPERNASSPMSWRIGSG
jgi:uncharacterized protein YbdZ (MbtH family)